MPLSSVNIIRQKGGLARPPLDKSGVSGFVIYGATKAIQKKYFTAVDVLEDFDLGTMEEYHLRQYFDYSESPLYVETTQSGPTDFQEIEDLKNFAEGEPRQYAVLNLSTIYNSTDVTGIQAKLDELEEEYAPAIAIYSAPLDTATVEDLTSLTTLDSNRVSVIIGEDTTSEVATLRASYGFVSCIGATLGNISKANIQENIGWVGKFNLTNVDNYLQLAFIDGSLVSSKSNAFLNSLDDFGYIFLRKYIGLEGAYHNYSYTATAVTSDFQTIENNRVYDKAFRLLYSAYLPQVNSPILVNNNGQLEVSVVKYLEGVGKNQLQSMADANEISSYSVGIDAKQDVLSTSTVEVVATIVPVGVAKEINIKLGFALTV